MSERPPDRADGASRFEEVRRANRTETAEDYVEAIAEVVAERGEARVTDLAALFGVSHVTVSRTVERLRRDGLVTTRPYRAIALTEAGAELAERARARHLVVVRFLLALGVPREAAFADAEGIEHHVSEATLAAFERFAAERGVDPAAADDAPRADPARFARVRAAHASELAEDYVEAIADLVAEKGRARVVDLARHFGVGHAAVSRTIARLERDGWVRTKPYAPVTLTAAGATLAAESRARHEVVRRLLIALGLPEEVADTDSEGMEHHVGPATLARFAELAGPGPGA